MRAIASLVALALPCQLAAQYDALNPGDRIRVKAPSVAWLRLDGTLMSPVDDTVRIAVPVRGAAPDRPGAMRHYAIPVSQILVLEHRTRRSHAAGILRGFKVTLASLLAFATGCMLGTEGEDAAMCVIIPFVLGLPALALGGVIGGLIGFPGWEMVAP